VQLIIRPLIMRSDLEVKYNEIIGPALRMAAVLQGDADEGPFIFLYFSFPFSCNLLRQAAAVEGYI